MEMNPSGEITIRTTFSNYSFRVIDPEQRKGVLSGGRLGTELHEAIFIETIHPTNKAEPLLGQLEPGDRAVFLVGSNNVQKLTTSTIKEIILSEPSDPSDPSDPSEMPPDDC